MLALRVVWTRSWYLFAALIFTSAIPALGAIRLGQPQSASGEIDLGRIPDPETSVFLRIRPAAWVRFAHPQGADRKTVDPPASRVLEHLAGSMDSSMASIFRLCFCPGVDEFLVAKWPSRFLLGVERPVWMIGLALGAHGEVEPLANEVIASCSPAESMVSERRLKGFPLTSLSLPGRSLHLLRGERHLLISPNLFLLQAYLEDLDSPPDPPSASRPDALIGWRPTADLLERNRPSSPNSGRLFERTGIDRFEISVQSLPVGLEVRLAVRTPFRSSIGPPFRPLNTNLLDSIPAGSDLVVAGGGLDLLANGSVKGLGGHEAMDRPFALGVEVPGGERNTPRFWRVGGAFEREVAVASPPSPVSKEISERIDGFLDGLNPMGIDLESLAVEDRIVFGEAAQGSPPPPEAQQLKDHFTEVAREAVLAGVVSPGLLVLPLYWDVLLDGESEADRNRWMNEEWTKEVAPLEFSLNRTQDGLEVRLLSASPTSYVMLLADLFFFLQVDYAGEWNSLFGQLEAAAPSPPGGSSK